jgi:two-component system nitrate/nitrite response regulator NarL
VTHPDRMTPSSNGATVILTAQERAVLAASAKGLGVIEVAQSLDLSPEAVRAAIASAAEKLGARSKLEAVVIALRTGLIDLPREPGRSDDPDAS